jgi:AbrB family looped-hinge helix DNA binding protein
MTKKTPPRQLEKSIRATLSSRNAITLPVDVRRQLGIGPGDEIEIVVDQ